MTDQLQKLIETAKRANHIAHLEKLADEQGFLLGYARDLGLFPAVGTGEYALDPEILKLPPFEVQRMLAADPVGASARIYPKGEKAFFIPRGPKPPSPELLQAVESLSDDVNYDGLSAGERTALNRQIAEKQSEILQSGLGESSWERMSREIHGKLDAEQQTIVAKRAKRQKLADVEESPHLNGIGGVKFTPKPSKRAAFTRTLGRSGRRKTIVL